MSGAPKARKTAKRVHSFLASRSTLFFVAMALQVGILVAVLQFFSRSFYLFYAGNIVLSFAAVVWILNNRSNPAYKLAWIIPILAFPIFGGLFYLFFGKTQLSRSAKRRMRESAGRVAQAGDPGEANLAALRARNPEAALQSRYLSAVAGFPLWQGTATEYLASGEEAFARIKEALESAQRFIFLEFFIIGEGRMWGEILEILERKARGSLDVRVMYDDFGCLNRIPADFERRLEAKGIHCAVFNPLRPVLSSSHNHRDHRKILVVDGRIAFTGGINLADEYINEYERFGRWKDNAIRLEGEAVASFTQMFLELWTHARRKRRAVEEIEDGEFAQLCAKDFYAPAASVGVPSDGFVQPYEDSPLDEEPVGECVYLNLIARAKRELYIATPYLVIDHEMMTALTLAARDGVDVRIITPHIPDKWYVHAVTRANYRPLLESGARVFEYAPGFIHQKTFVADGECGTVGTVNLDFRSLYLHFECGVWLCGCGSVAAMRGDFLRTQEESQEIALADLDGDSFAARAAGWFLRIFSPML
jgi:cardiolipin synthase